MRKNFISARTMVFIYNDILTATSEEELKRFAPDEWHDYWGWMGSAPKIELNSDKIKQAKKMGAVSITAKQLETLKSFWYAAYRIRVGFYP